MIIVSKISDVEFAPAFNRKTKTTSPKKKSNSNESFENVLQKTINNKMN